MSWTEEQEYAIETREKSLLVSAAAGSGKTAILVERIVKLIIEDKVDVDRFLVVTFTRAAAEEMKVRIYNALIRKLKSKYADKEFINRQISYLPNASINTLHSFCLDIVMRYFQIIDLDPGLKIGDETQLKILKDKALNKLLEEEYAKEDQVFTELLEMYNNYRDESRIKKMIESFHLFLVNRPYPQEWTSQVLNNFELSETEFNNSEFYQQYRYITENKLCSAIQLIEHSIKLARRLDDDKPIQVLQGEKDQLENIRHSLKKGYSDFYYKLNERAFGTLRMKTDDLNLKDEIKHSRDKAKKIYNNIKGGLRFNSPEHILDDLREIKQHIVYLTDLSFRYHSLYNVMKLDRNLMDFNDIEHYTLEILQNNEIVYELKEQYKYIFVDEYQDSNEIQDAIVSKIMRKDNVFFVGDVKQSIYKFRMADPTLFTKKYDDFKGSKSEQSEVINLNKNFRSRRTIVNFINAVFERIMSRHTGEIEYDSNSRLYVGGNQQEGGRVSITIIEDDKEDISAEEIMEIDSIETEAHYISKKINELVNDGVYDENTGEHKKISYSDIVILLRSTKNWAETYYEIMNSQGIPVYAESQTGYFDTMEIRLIIQLLKIIDNIYQDIPLISVMRSPIFSFSIDEITKIRLHKNDSSYYSALKAYVDEFDDSLSQKLNAMILKIDCWKKQSRYMPIHDFIWNLLINTGYYNYISAMPGGKQRQANIRILVDRAKQFSDSNVKGLFNFIQLIEGIRETDRDLASAKIIGPSEEVVRIMTIHKSKGLEFPVVFIGGLGKKINLQDIRDPIILHKDLGICPDYINLQERRYCPSILKSIAKEKLRLETISEEMRILYVAMTRARDMLFLIGTIKDWDKYEIQHDSINSYDISTADSYFDWLIPVTNEVKCQLTEFNQIKASEIVKNIDQEVQRSDDIKKKLRKIEKESAINTDIKNMLNWEYEYESLSRKPTKTTVTELKEGAPTYIKVSESFNTPKFIKGKEISGTQRGNNLHWILQHLDLTNIKNELNLEKEVKKQVEYLCSKILGDEETNQYYIDKTLGFFQSSLGMRMLDSNKIYREKAFNYKMGVKGDAKDYILVQGIIDCFFLEGDEYVLVDYKSDYYDDETSKKALILNYTPQIELYRTAIERLTGIEVRYSYIYLFHRGDTVLI